MASKQFLTAPERPGGSWDSVREQPMELAGNGDVGSFPSS